MEGVVVAIIALLAGGDVVPGVEEADAVAVAEVQVEAQVGGAAREPFEHKAVVAEQRIESIVQGILHVSERRTGGGSVERHRKTEKGG